MDGWFKRHREEVEHSGVLQNARRLGLWWEPRKKLRGFVPTCYLDLISYDVLGELENFRLGSYMPPRRSYLKRLPKELMFKLNAYRLYSQDGNFEPRHTVSAKQVFKYTEEKQHHSYAHRLLKMLDFDVAGCRAARYAGMGGWPVRRYFLTVHFRYANLVEPAGPQLAPGWLYEFLTINSFYPLAGCKFRDLSGYCKASGEECTTSRLVFHHAEYHANRVWYRIDAEDEMSDSQSI
jgi:hypothetical protein